MPVENSDRLEDYENLTAADYENLPPLVAKGQIREQVLAEVIDRWATQTSDLFEENGEFLRGFDSWQTHPATLKRVDLRDDNPGADPIDLGADLLKPLADRLAVRECDAQAAADTHADGDMPIQRTPKVAATLIACRIRQAEAQKVELPLTIVLRSCHVSGSLDFSEACFTGNADFSQNSFGGRVDFGGATFSKNVDFDHADCSRTAYFGNAAFRGSAKFEEAGFRAGGAFPFAEFSGFTDFSRTSFALSARAARDDFDLCAVFIGATFLADAVFTDATFDGVATFDCASFRKGVQFDAATFCSHADFGCSTVSGVAGFHRTTFATPISFPSADLRRANVASTGPLVERLSPEESRRRWATDFVCWQWVRKTGELTALTRVSYAALIGVPLLAGLWGPARQWIAQQNGAMRQTGEALARLIEKVPPADGLAQELRSAIDGLTTATLPETMPTGWLLAFLASFAVVLAQFVYQFFAPEVIREASEADLVDAANEINRQDGTISNERLRQAIDFLEQAAEKLPHLRSQWFVRRGNRTVWIPENVDQHFVDAMIDEPRPADAPADWQPTKRVKAPDQEVDAEDRKRIAIEEGQKARYAIASFEQRSAAWVSGGLYVLAGYLTVMIVLRQLAHVAEVSPAAWLAWPLYALTWGPLIAVLTLGILVAVGWGAWQVRNDG